MQFLVAIQAVLVTTMTSALHAQQPTLWYHDSLSLVSGLLKMLCPWLFLQAAGVPFTPVSACASIQTAGLRAPLNILITPSAVQYGLAPAGRMCWPRAAALFVCRIPSWIWFSLYLPLPARCTAFWSDRWPDRKVIAACGLLLPHLHVADFVEWLLPRYVLIPSAFRGL
jgi:hypothetical protein